MIIPKTNWTAQDYFELEDYIRITGNLNETAVGLGLSPVNYVISGPGAVLIPHNKVQIANQCAAIAAVKGWPAPVSSDGPYWYNWQELNRIEQLCIDVVDIQERMSYGADVGRGNGATYGGGARG